MKTLDQIITNAPSGNVVSLGAAREIEVLRETEKAALLLLSDARGAQREVWFPKAVLSAAPSEHGPQFPDEAYATRSFVGRNHLWHWTAA